MPTAPISEISGTVLDSLRGGVLAGAIVQLLPAGREAISSDSGTYAFRNVAPGTYRVRVLHAMLDTLGVAVVTPEFTVLAETGRLSVPVAVPTAGRLSFSICSPAQRLRGPAALVGFVRDAETDLPRAGARISLMFTIQDPARLTKESAVRETRTDSLGRYRLCGLPLETSATLQVQHGDLSSPEIPVSVGGELVELRGLALSAFDRAITVRDDSGRTTTLLVGAARLSGRVIDPEGRPVTGARVQVVGTSRVATTNDEGRFALDSLPSGSHTVQARKIPFTVAEAGVNLSARSPAISNITMTDVVPTLGAVRTVSRRATDLEDVGFARRRKTGNGFTLEGESVNRGSPTFSESLMGVPGVRVVKVAEMGDKYLVADARNPNGCVNFVVDGTPWRSATAGDVDTFVKPEDVQALEVYRASSIPIEFARPDGRACLTIVVWTRRKVRPLP